MSLLRVGKLLQHHEKEDDDVPRDTSTLVEEDGREN